MCTFILLYKLLHDYPVIALHNRYLGLDTKEMPPRNRNGVYCPLDVDSNGTWIGFNHDGLFMAITNQETQTIKNPARSRGLLALDALKECGSSAEAKDYLMDPSIRGFYRPGNFVVADGDDAWHILWDGVTAASKISKGPFAMGVVTMYPGIVMSERAEKICSDSEKRRIRALSLLRGYQPTSIEATVEKMKEVSADHEYGKSTASICWHSTEFKQTSSTIVALGETRRVYYCPGNHCENEFTQYHVGFD